MAKMHHRGHKIFYDYAEEEWYYNDGTQCHANDRKKCAYCGMPPTKEGYDYCLGHILNAKFACCGHGGRQKRYIKWEDGTIDEDF